MLDERIKRQRALVKILKSKPYTTQDDVASALESEGFEVTQSSISRDFRELGVVKVGGRYTSTLRFTGDANSAALQGLIKNIDPAGGNLLVVKTTPGAANVVAARLDEKDLNEVVGTIAGDDTIFVATKTKRGQAHVIQALEKLDRIF
ncbi:arginine repressor [bacterium]|nr:arginine repressor [bacterium]